MTKTLFILTLSLILLASAYPAEGAVPAPLGYEAFIETVQRNHPESVIEHDKLKQSQKLAERSGYLADPQLSIGRDYVPLKDKNKSDMDMAEENNFSAQWKLGLAQTFPWPGTLSAENEVANLQVVSTQIQNDLSSFRRKLDAADLYLKIVRTRKLLEIEEKNFRAIDGIRELTHEKFKQGIGSHYEFLQAHSESGVAKINVASFTADLENFERHAQILVGDSTKHSTAFSYEWPKTLLETKFNEPESKPDFNELTIETEKKQALARQAYAAKSTLPSLMISGELMEDDNGMQMYGAMVGVSLPIFSMQKRKSITDESQIIQAQASQHQAWQSRLKALALAQTQRRYSQLQLSIEILDKEIIPPIKEHIEATTAQFSQGKLDIVSIIAARRTLLNLETSRVRSIEALARTALAIEKIHHGLYDDELDIEIPQIVTSQGSMKMGNEAMTSMRQGRLKREKNNVTPGAEPSKMNPDMSEPASQPTSSGMGM